MCEYVRQFHEEFRTTCAGIKWSAYKARVPHIEYTLLPDLVNVPRFSEITEECYAVLFQNSILRQVKLPDLNVTALASLFVSILLRLRWCLGPGIIGDSDGCGLVPYGFCMCSPPELL